MSELSTYKIYSLSESSAVIDFGNVIDENINNKVLAMQKWLQEHPFPGLKDLVTAYSSLTVLFDPFIIYRMLRPASTVFNFVKDRLQQAFEQSPDAGIIANREFRIPVCYDLVFGYDIETMSAEKQLGIDELISIHCSLPYRVFMIGFLPGFAYMGRIDERLVTPRRAQPREVEAGSIGIAGCQTGIYPFASPGGWQIIGRTPVKLFNTSAESPALLSAGDTVQFYPVSMEEFESIHSSNHLI